MPSQGGHGEDDIAIETFSDCDSGQLSDEGNEDDLGLRDILFNRLQDNEFNDMDNDGYILGDYLTNAHYDIQCRHVTYLLVVKRNSFPQHMREMLRYQWYLV